MAILNAVHNAIFGNSIYDNTGLGIDLGDDGATANDAGDADTGANDLQNTPVFQSAVIDGSGDLQVTFKVDSNPANVDYGANGLRVEFFVRKSTGVVTFVAFDLYTSTDYSTGFVTVNLGSAASLDVSLSDDLLATATDDDGNTSEFSSLTTVQ